MMAILNFYMYLSLDRIKDFFKFLNDKLAEHGKKKIESISNFAMDKTKS